MNVMDDEKNVVGENLFGNRNFVLILFGQIVSNVGNALFSIAVIWYLMTQGTEENVGLIMSGFSICMILPYVLVGPIGGAFVDRFDRRKIIYMTDLIRGALFVVLTGLIYFDIMPIVSIFAVTVLSNGLSTFFNASIDASIPNIVGESDLNKANSYNGISRQLTLIVGSAVAGFLYYYIGFVGVLAINSISFILSGISEMFIHFEKQKQEKINFKHILTDMREGIDYIKGHGALLKTVMFFTVLNLIVNPLYMIVFPKVVKFDLMLTAKELGIFEAIFSVGAIMGMIVVSKMPVKKSGYTVFAKTLVAQCLIFLVFGIPIMPVVLDRFSGIQVLWMWSALGVVFAIINALLNIPLFTILQSRVEDDFRGRVFAMISTLSQAATPVGFILIGILSDKVPSWLLFMICGVLSILVSFVFLRDKEIKAYW